MLDKLISELIKVILAFLVGKNHAEKKRLEQVAKDKAFIADKWRNASNETVAERLRRKAGNAGNNAKLH